MEAMTPWLLLIIAALIAVSVSLYFQGRQVQSEARGTQSFIADELRDAEAALLSALERIRRMDRMLSAREQALASVAPAAASTGSADDAAPRPERAVGGSDGAAGERPGRSYPEEPVVSPPQTKIQTPPFSSRLRALELAEAGLTPFQIARDLELPVGEVELALALRTRPEPGAGGESRLGSAERRKY